MVLSLFALLPSGLKDSVADAIRRCTACCDFSRPLTVIKVGRLPNSALLSRIFVTLSAVWSSRSSIIWKAKPSPAHITANQPIFVTQYSHSSDVDDVLNSDPFMVLLPHTGLFSKEHMVCVAGNEFAENFINVVVPTAAAGSVQVDGAIPPAVFAAIGASGYSGAQIPVTPGPHNVTASAPFGTLVYGFAQYDAYGFPGSFFLADLTPPTLTCPVTNLTIQVGTNCVAFVPDFRRDTKVSDDCDPEQQIVITQTPPPGTTIGPGVHVVTLSATDAAGNVGSCQIIITVIDPSPLVLNCPEGIAVRCTSSAGTVVNYSVSAHTRCDTNIQVICKPPPGSTFPPGLTPVTCEARTADGKTASCTFLVRVVCTRLEVKISNLTLNLTFATERGFRYSLDFKSSLNEPAWTEIRVMEGDGLEASFTEPLGQLPSGFYRVRVE